MTSMNIDRPLDDIVRETKLKTVLKEGGRTYGRGGRRGRKPRPSSTGNPGRDDVAMTDSAPDLRVEGGGVSKRNKKAKPASQKPPGSPSKAFGNSPPRNKNTGGRVVVANLASKVSTADIRELFGGVGPLRKASVILDALGRSTGTAEVLFQRREDALLAVQQYNNVPLDHRPMSISLSTKAGSISSSVDRRTNVDSGKLKMGSRKPDRAKPRRTSSGSRMRL
uniref:RRM domain-containing protein n=1 Tax=Compsopogon caeruleus TaxID=31354 RepID=A0A7S1XBH5_9RHOD|mmetsp:Transcript_12108/g.24672  ORF Transcript_12108/g.24672 Transcript_12108/m.24672 type:complete len:223 (+) Transcript_12108:151-819(+)|eukprot:CAMPEP_0184683620 /NCGR_PEP_ID=MMETSP0312-20130426/11981_1 /TAXON_ID=31354 /ORGANISM="Compsopogon coeruleus, Strain SAG 36.94" /LENGTH=222 /DNA_ID=CAMNT_0027136085 /DNA_START=108 /DNA_END=776 /DNA_ORIENTATION=-